MTIDREGEGTGCEHLDSNAVVSGAARPVGSCRQTLGLVAIVPLAADPDVVGVFLEGGEVDEAVPRVGVVLQRELDCRSRLEVSRQSALFTASHLDAAGVEDPYQGGRSASDRVDIDDQAIAHRQFDFVEVDVLMIGQQPDVIADHSVGEIAAAVADFQLRIHSTRKRVVRFGSRHIDGRR